MSNSQITCLILSYGIVFVSGMVATNYNDDMPSVMIFWGLLFAAMGCIFGAYS